MIDRTAAILTRAAREAGADESALTDRELLRRFADLGDESAFAALVARHSRMVLGLCRRHLPTVQDAEDACQATFLILARKAGAGLWQTSAANWLYTTARRVAAKARRTAERRARREGRAAVREPVTTLDEITGRELLAVLDEELGKLPALYREPLVLCYLEGLSRDEAAARLGVSPGTVKTRLERGRRRLEAALARRGIGLGLLTLALSVPAGASPPRLNESILAAVCGSPPAAVAALAQGARMGTALRTVLVAAVVAVSAAGLLAQWNAAGQSPTRTDGASAGPVPPAGVAHPAPLPVSTAAAPVPEDADGQAPQDVAAAREKAIRFLKGQQQPDGMWEGTALNLLAGMEGGTTALVTLALLEGGVPADDQAVAKAIEYLTQLPPKKTYVVSLQTQVLAKVGQKKHAAQIQKNADWLIDQAIGFKNGRLEGWSYPGNTVGDGSNTHFAVVALHAAARAGAKVDAKVWAAIRDHYVRTQRDGGWTYHAANLGDAKATPSMTGAGLVGLALAAQHDQETAAGKEAFEKGMKRFLSMPDVSPQSTAYLWLVTAELGRATETRVFKSGDKEVAWYREGAARLVKDQRPNGSWAFGQGLDTNPLLTTAFGLYFLG
ncbi:MAG TPA: sigma-70 family RNA polymerase sigma factor, partial [Gemmataceae bacterium]|nr:sigma-70 family RNA polymerase sigma factor [Gemmataceae bacterium]